MSIDYDAKVSFSPEVTLAVLGVIGVFAALIALMLVVKAVGRKKGKGGESPQPMSGSASGNDQASPVRAAPQAGMIPAPGSQGDIDLYSVDDHTAALLMAIVADDLKAELNTLRFISIREVG